MLIRAARVSKRTTDSTLVYTKCENVLSPERRRCAVERAQEQHGLSERHACRLLGQWRGTQRYGPMQRPDEEELTRAVIALATQYGRYG